MCPEEVKRQGREAETSHLSTTEVKNKYTSTRIQRTFSYGVNSSKYTVMWNKGCDFWAVKDFSGAGVEQFVHRWKTSSFFIPRTTFLQFAVQDQRRLLYNETAYVS